MLMAKTKAAKKLEELRPLCKTYKRFQELTKKPDEPSEVIERLSKELNKIGTEIINIALEWYELAPTRSQRTGGQT
jgi:hypothetical protein